jgi:hypothetical protein
MAKRKTGNEESCSGAGQNSRTGHADAMRNALRGLAAADNRVDSTASAPRRGGIHSPLRLQPP